MPVSYGPPSQPLLADGDVPDAAVRDDVNSLPIPDAAKRYARRKGLKSMMRQPKDFQRVNAMITNPGKPDKFRNYDAVGKVRHAFKEHASSLARQMVETLLSEDDETLQSTLEGMIYDAVKRDIGREAAVKVATSYAADYVKHLAKLGITTSKALYGGTADRTGFSLDLMDGRTVEFKPRWRAAKFTGMHGLDVDTD